MSACSHTPPSDGVPIAEGDRRQGAEALHTEAVRRMFDGLADRYDFMNRLLSAGIDQRWRRHAARTLASAPPGPLLDSCAGTLDLSAMLERLYPERSIAAVDLSPGMLERGRSRGKVTRTRLAVADACALPFADAHFAGIVCGFGMRNIAEPRRAIAEARRVLMPGGLFVVLDFFRPSETKSRVFHSLYASWAIPRVGRALAGDQQAYEYLVRSIQGFRTREEFAKDLIQAGFGDIQVDHLLFGIASIVRGKAPR